MLLYCWKGVFRNPYTENTYMYILQVVNTLMYSPFLYINSTNCICVSHTCCTVAYNIFFVGVDFNEKVEIKFIFMALMHMCVTTCFCE